MSRDIQPQSEPGFVYAICEEGTYETKEYIPVRIGYAKNVEQRLASLQEGNCRKLLVAAKVEYGSAAQLEPFILYLGKCESSGGWYLMKFSMIEELFLCVKA